MARFNAGAAVSALEYDFTTCVGLDGQRCVGKGKIPEFGDEQLGDFQATVAAIQERFGSDIDAMARADTEDIKQANDELIEAVASFCQGQPSRDELAGLPWRVRQAFFSWLFGELFDPKGSRSGTRN